MHTRVKKDLFNDNNIAILNNKVLFIISIYKLDKNVVIV